MMMISTGILVLLALETMNSRMQKKDSLLFKMKDIKMMTVSLDGLQEHI